MQGKYSPTVSGWYAQDQDWFKKNGGGFDNGKNPESDNDDDGFDSYGYSLEDGTGPDRCGFREHEYAADDSLYEHIASYTSNRVLPYVPDELQPGDLVELESGIRLIVHHVESRLRVHLTYMSPSDMNLYGGTNGAYALNQPIDSLHISHVKKVEK